MSSHSEAIPLSALQHWLFCPRQYALIHIERLWTENRYTAEGRVIHERVDGGRPETRPGIRILRSVALKSERFGIYGVADVVELLHGQPYPVEYKRGKPKTHRADEVQLCAQGLCLEEMFACDVPEGALYYGKTRRRQVVLLDEELRQLTRTTIKEIRACRDAGILPLPEYVASRCNKCSLIEHCMPRQIGARRKVDKWLSRMIGKQGIPE
ncbi:MAG: CRISPR-associated protein Cas4 [Gammaproteobacteria bacterium]|nr:CRISPR-associated protein Cas4 [Gammaproteobacteria bacterium]MDE0612439.1 CRISPR-associated protein Cas4 [Gammaproteobacteria bacterium]